MTPARRATLIVLAGVVVVVAAVLIVLSIGGDDDGTAGSTTTTEATGTTEPGSTTTSAGATTTTGAEPTTTTSEPATEVDVRVYFLRDEHLAVGSRTVEGPAVARAALEALLAGPDGFETGTNMTTAIPAGTRLLDVALDGGVLTVDLDAAFASGGGSFSMTARVAQVVFTATQFPTVDAVRFLVDGRPVDALGGEGLLLTEPQTRADWFDLLPEVLVESPATGATIDGSPLRLTGISLTFEATWRVEIVDGEGLIVGDEVVTAVGGTEYLPFDVEVEFGEARPGVGEIVVSYDSARDGSRVVVDSIPVRFP